MSLQGFIQDSIRFVDKRVNNQEGFSTQNPESARLLAALLSVILVIFLILFVGKYIWNTHVRALIPGLRPATSYWQILGLYVFSIIMLGR